MYETIFCSALCTHHKFANICLLGKLKTLQISSAPNVSFKTFTQLVDLMSWVEGPICTPWELLFCFLKLAIFIKGYVHLLVKNCVLLVILCLLQFWWSWWLPGQYRAGTHWMAASSCFQWSPGCAPYDDAHCITPLHCHGHQNHQKFSFMFRNFQFRCCPQP